MFSMTHHRSGLFRVWTFNESNRLDVWLFSNCSLRLDDLFMTYNWSTPDIVFTDTPSSNRLPRENRSVCREICNYRYVTSWLSLSLSPSLYFHLSLITCWRTRRWPNKMWYSSIVIGLIWRDKRKDTKIFKIFLLSLIFRFVFSTDPSSKPLRWEIDRIRPSVDVGDHVTWSHTLVDKEVMKPELWNRFIMKPEFCTCVKSHRSSTYKVFAKRHARVSLNAH